MNLPQSVAPRLRNAAEVLTAGPGTWGRRTHTGHVGPATLGPHSGPRGSAPGRGSSVEDSEGKYKREGLPEETLEASNAPVASAPV